MNTSLATAYNSNPTRGLFVSQIPCGGLTLDQLAGIGIVATDDVHVDRTRRCLFPSDWTAVPAEVSPFQMRLHDGDNRLRAKLYLKPGSQGGGNDFEVFPRYTVAMATDETHQWAEVYDGNVKIYTTDSALKADRNLDAHGFNSRTQPEFVEAEAWLAERRPDHKNPLAYWN